LPCLSRQGSPSYRAATALASLKDYLRRNEAKAIKDKFNASPG
jgi:hypothetical protein